jgi:beta-lactam-binding protein with PASTA domain
VRVPDVMGKGARASVLALHHEGLVATLAGTGAVVEQSPEPGKAVARGATISLILRRPQRPDDKDATPSDKDSTLASAALTQVVP